MRLDCNFEELGALRKGANALLGEDRGGEALVAAPPEGREEVEFLLLRLSGELDIDSLEEQRRLHKGIKVIVDRLKEEMDLFITEAHPADESAVASYFLYAHALAVLKRMSDLGQEMEALIEVVTGVPATEAMAKTFVFPT